MTDTPRGQVRVGREQLDAEFTRALQRCHQAAVPKLPIVMAALIAPLGIALFLAMLMHLA